MDDPISLNEIEHVIIEQYLKKVVLEIDDILKRHRSEWLIFKELPFVAGIPVSVELNGYNCEFYVEINIKNKTKQEKRSDG
jgi:hypothetical protein